MIFVLLILTAALAAAPAAIPKNDGWVTDQADMMTAQQEATLETLMESYRSGTTHEIALLTVSSLKGQALEQFALEVARGWGIGGKDSHNGALLLIAKNERKIRIEVGRGLEGNLTDAASGLIIRNIIQPEFKRGRLYEGMSRGILAMHAAIGGDYGPISRSRSSRRTSGGGAALLMIALGILVFTVLALRRGGRGGRGGRRGGSGVIPWLIMAGMMSHGRRGYYGGRSSGFGGGGGFSGGGFGGFGGGGGFSGGGASGGW